MGSEIQYPHSYTHMTQRENRRQIQVRGDSIVLMILQSCALCQSLVIVCGLVWPVFACVCVLGEWGIESAGNFLIWHVSSNTGEQEGETKLGAKQRSRQELIERENGRLQQGRLGIDDFWSFSTSQTSSAPRVRPRCAQLRPGPLSCFFPFWIWEKKD